MYVVMAPVVAQSASTKPTIVIAIPVDGCCVEPMQAPAEQARRLPPA